MPKTSVKNQFIELFQDGLVLEFELDNELYVSTLVFARHPLLGRHSCWPCLTFKVLVIECIQVYMHYNIQCAICISTIKVNWKKIVRCLQKQFLNLPKRILIFKWIWIECKLRLGFWNRLKERLTAPSPFLPPLLPNPSLLTSQVWKTVVLPYIPTSERKGSVFKTILCVALPLLRMDCLGTLWISNNLAWNC